MRRIRDLLRLKHENGLSSRLIATSLGISKGAVGDYLQRAGLAGLAWPLPAELTDTALERLLFPDQPKPTAVPRPEPSWAYVDQELRRTGATRSLLWPEYRAEHPDGYGYAWFASHAKSPGRRRHITIAEHMPSSHRRHAAWTPARMLAAAERIGPAAAGFFDAIMTARPHPEQGFRTCLGILALEKTYGRARLEAACERPRLINARSAA